MNTKRLFRLDNLTFMAALLGLAAGFWMPDFSIQVGFLGDIFLTLLRMMIVPLILVSVFLAVAKQSAQGELSKIGYKTLGYFVSTSTFACLTGMLAANLLPDDDSKIEL